MKKMEKLKILAGILPGIDDFIGYFVNKQKASRPGSLSVAEVIPWTLRLKRIMSIVAMTVIILGFLGALALPIPGVAPLYGAAVAGGLKAFGITLGYTAAARAVGGFIGACVDRLRMSMSNIKINKKINPFNAAFYIGFLGENGYIVIEKEQAKNRKKAQKKLELEEKKKQEEQKRENKDEGNSKLNALKNLLAGSLSQILARINHDDDGESLSESSGSGPDSISDLDSMPPNKNGHSRKKENDNSEQRSIVRESHSEVKQSHNNRAENDNSEQQSVVRQSHSDADNSITTPNPNDSVARKSRS